MLAAKKLITNPYTAIAAGIALVAIAGAASAAINKSHKSTIGGSGGASGSGIERSNSRPFTPSSTDAQDVKVTGNAVIRGQDLYVIFQNYQNNNQFTRANG
jgi:hypothetical protein